MTLVSDQEFVTLGTRVVGEGITETKAELDQFTESAGRAEQNAQRLREASGGLSRSQQEVARTMREAQEATRRQAEALAIAQQQTRQAATSAAKEIENIFIAESSRIREAIARGFLTPAEARAAAIEAAQAYNSALIAQLDRLGAVGLNQTNSKTYIELANSLKSIPAPLREVAETGAVAGASMNSLRAAAVSMAASATSAVPGVTQLASVLGTMAIGAPIIAGVLAGAAAIAYGWQVWTRDAKAAREEQDKLTQSLSHWYDVQRAGAGGERAAQVAAETAKLAEQQKELDSLVARLNSPAIQGSEAGRVTGELIQKQVDALRDLMQRERDIIRQGNADVLRQRTDDFVRRQAEEASELAALISSGHATEAERKRALDALKRDQSLAQQYATPLGAADSSLPLLLKQRTELVQAAKQLEDALYPKVEAPTRGAEDPERQRVIDGLLKQLEALRAVNLEGNKELSLAQLKAQALGVEGGVRDLINAKIKAEEETLVAYGRDSGVVLTERLKFIQATKDQETANANAKIKLEDQTFAQRTLTNAIKEANDVAAKNQKTTRDSLTEGLDLYIASEREAERLSDIIGRDLVNSMIRFAASGTQSFTGFLTVVEQTSLRVSDAIQRSVEKQQELLLKSQKAGPEGDAEARIILERIANLQKLQAVLGGIGAATAGANIGFNIGQQTTSGFNGFGAGGIAGAVTGFEIAGPLGAVIGGLTGAAGGLFGAAEAHRRAAKAIEDAAHSLATNIASYTNSNPVAQQITDNIAKHDQLILQAQELAAERARQAGRDGSRTEAEAAVLGLKNDTAAIDKGRIDNLNRIADEFFSGIEQQLNATRGPAGDYANRLAEIDKAHQQNIASVNALAGALGYSNDQRLAEIAKVNELADAQAAAVKRAYEETLRQTQYGLDAREAYARGLTLEGDAITRRAAEEKELFDAEAAGYTQVQLAQLQRIQALERERAALQAYNDASNAYLSALAKGPTGTSASQLEADLAPLTQRRDADLAVLNDAVSAYATDLLQGADASKIAADYQALLTAKTILLGDEAQIAATKFANAAQQMQQAQSDIQRDISLGVKGGKEGIAAEQTAFGFGGLSIDQILALYKPFTGTPLSNQDETTNNLIKQFLQDYDAVYGTKNGKAIGDQVADAITAATSKSPTGDAVQYAAKAISEVTANRLADYTYATYQQNREQTGYLRDIRDAVTGGRADLFSRAPLTVDFPTLANWLPSNGQPAPSFPPSGAPAQTVQGGDVRIDAVNIIMPNVDPTKLTEQELDDFAEKVVTIIGNKLRARHIAVGDATLLGG